jgi:hypothetical protein
MRGLQGGSHDAEELRVVAEADEFLEAGPRPEGEQGRGGVDLAGPARPEIRPENEGQAADPSMKERTNPTGAEFPCIILPGHYKNYRI